MKKKVICLIVMSLFGIGIILMIEMSNNLKQRAINTIKESRQEHDIKKFYDIDESVISKGENLDVRFNFLANYNYKLESRISIIRKKEVDIEKVEISIPYLEDMIFLQKGSDIFAHGFNRCSFLALHDFIDINELSEFETKKSKDMNLDGTKLTFVFSDGEQENHILKFDLDIALDKVRITNFDSFLKVNKSYKERNGLNFYFDQLYFYDVSLYEKEVMKFREALNKNEVKDDDISPFKYVYMILRYDEYLSNDFYKMVAKDLKEAYYQKSNLDQGFRYELCVLLESINKKLNFYDQTKLSDEGKKFWNGGHISIDKILKEIE